MYSFEEIEAVDPEVAAAIAAEIHRQQTHLELIASENWASKACMAKSRPSQGMRPSAILALQFKKKIPHKNVMTFISEVPGVTSVEEL